MVALFVTTHLHQVMEGVVSVSGLDCSVRFPNITTGYAYFKILFINFKRFTE